MKDSVRAKIESVKTIDCAEISIADDPNDGCPELLKKWSHIRDDASPTVMLEAKK